MRRRIIAMTLAWLLAWPLALHAQSTNGVVVLLRGAITPAGGSTGAEGPVRVVSAVGQPIGGRISNGVVQVLIDTPTILSAAGTQPPPPTGTQPPPPPLPQQTPDTVAPSGTVVINGGNEFTNALGVILTLSAVDDRGTVALMKFSVDDVTYTDPPEKYAATRPWTFIGADSLKTIFVKFADPAGNWSTAAQDSITVDRVAPEIVQPSVTERTPTGAVITWTTNEPTQGLVEYGRTGAYGQTVTSSTSFTTSHRAPLSGLDAGAVYHYQIQARDRATNPKFSSDLTLTTASATPPTTEPPPTGTTPPSQPPSTTPPATTPPPDTSPPATPSTTPPPPSTTPPPTTQPPPPTPAGAVVEGQPTNGLTTLVQRTLSSAGGRIAAAPAGQVVFSLGEFGGGSQRNATTEVIAGYPHDQPLWLPPSTRTITVTGTVDDSTASVVVSAVHETRGTVIEAKPATVSAGTFSVDITLPTGRNTITVTATDQAGNPATASVTVTVRTASVQPPSRPLILTPPAVTTQSTITLSGEKSPGTSLWINGREAIARNDQRDWTVSVNLIEGDNVFDVVAKDANGQSSTSSPFAVILDQQPPVISDLVYFDPRGQELVRDPSRQLPKTNFPQVTIRGQVDDSQTRVEINGQTVARAGRQFEAIVSLTRAGDNTLALRATSPNGHVTPQSLTVLLGAIPTITSVQPRAFGKLYVDAASTIQVSVQDADNDPTRVQIVLDGQVLFPWSSTASFAWTPLARHRGPHLMDVQAKDEFGSVTSKPVELYVARQPIPPKAP